MASAEGGVTVLLIGSTGNGKSTLGNFLLDPKADGSNEAFKTAIDNRPQTKICDKKSRSIEFGIPEAGDFDTKDDGVGSSDFDTELEDTTEALSGLDLKKTNLTVIDTPGLNEGAVSDLSHMINLIETLDKSREVSACILVVKFPCKIDQQFKDTIKYYSQLLPDLFEENVIIVMTGYGTDAYSEALRKRQKITPDTMKIMTENVIKEIMDIKKFNCVPMLFAIDSLPMDEKGAKDSERVRADVLSYAMSFNKINVQDLRVYKTKALLDKDAKDIEKLDGKISGYNEKLQEANQKAEAVLNVCEENEKVKTEMMSELGKLKHDLERKNCDDHIATNHWSVDDSKFLPWFRNSVFSISSDYDIVEVKKWATAGKFSNYKRDRRHVSGKVVGKFSRRLSARITVYTTKRKFFSQAIAELKESIEKKEADLKRAKTNSGTLKATHTQFKTEISQLEGYIESLRADITRLKNDKMTIWAARRRLGELKKMDTGKK